MGLAEIFGTSFPPHIRTRGEQILASGDVSSLEAGLGGVLALVRGSNGRDYEVWIDSDGEHGAISLWCDCAAFGRDGVCRHSWAAIRRVDQEGQGGAAPGVAVEGGRRGEAASSWRSWIAALADVDDSRTKTPDPWRRAPRPPVRYSFAILVPRSSRIESLEVEVLGQKRGRRGSYGAPSPVAFSPSLLDRSLHEEDRELLKALWEAHDRMLLGGYERTVSTSEVGSVNLLPKLVGSGRCRLRLGDDLSETPLCWDDGEPWIAGAAWNEGDGQGLLQGFLQRGETRRPLTDATVLLRSGFVVLDDSMSRVAIRPGMDLLELLMEKGPLVVPQAERMEFLKSLASLQDPPRLDVPDLADLEAAAPIPCFSIVAPDDLEPGNRRTLACSVEFEYRGTRARSRDPEPIIIDPAGSVLVQRDMEAEASHVQTVLALGARPAAHYEDRHDASVPIARFAEIVNELVGRGWIVEASGARVRKPGSWSIAVESGIDWFDVKGGLAFDGEIAPLPALLRAADSRSGIVRLGDGTLGLLPEKWLDRWGLLAGLGSEDEDGLRLRKHQGWVLDALLEARDDVRVDRTFEEYREKLAKLRRVTPGREGRAFAGELRPYQREGLGWFRFLRELGLGGCLADDMGLGKTVQVLAMLDLCRKQRGPRRPSLVLAPRSVVHNWVVEAARFTPRLKVIKHIGGERDRELQSFEGADMVVTTYGTLRRDILALKDHAFAYVILDESQAIKNERSQTAKAARLLRADHRLALSGTPVENHLGELWSLFEFLNPGMLGRSRTFRSLIGKDGAVEGDTQRRMLAAGLRPFILRRTKEQVLEDLPAKTEQVISCELEGRQKRDYEQVAQHYRAALLDGTRGPNLGRMKIQILEALLRLRQAACHPGLIDRSRVDEPSAKLEVLVPMLAEITEAGHKALVFSQFTKFLGIVRSRLEQAGIPFEYLDGRTRKRQEKIDRFQSDPDCHAFLISLKAGGLGLNLTAASYVFLLDPWWNPAVESQAVDRAHRIGQTRPVMIYRLIAGDTVEERIRALQDSKRALAEAIFGDDNALIRDLTAEDLTLLLS